MMRQGHRGGSGGAAYCRTNVTVAFMRRRDKLDEMLKGV